MTQSARRLLAALLAALTLAAGAAFAQTELRMTWYDDGSESEVMSELVERFEAENPDIDVVIDVVPYSSGILESLPLQLASGQGPDIARVTDLGGLQEYFLDLRPYLDDPAYWDANFGPFHDWMRADGSDAIPGFMTQLTVTGPYVNATLFEQAGVEMPGEGATWEDWAEATNEVAEATGVFAMAMDRTGHRLAGPAISMGAQYFDENGDPIVTDDGFRRMAELMVDWHADGTMIPDVWIGSQGSYVAGNEQFVNGQVALYMSGSWQIGQFTELIGDAFDWKAVPNPCGPDGTCTGMPGGAALVGIADTDHPEEVARLMDFLAQEEQLGEFYGRTLFIPGHLGLAESGVDFDADLPATQEALSQFAAEVPKLADAAYALQGYQYNRVVFDATRDRLTQVFVGELTLDEAIDRMQRDIEEQIAEAQ
mgnify:CR=1 FL=1